MTTTSVMAADSKQNMKTLRVDNWAVFFLQRLQLMFAKGDCCDLTLKFHTGQELKVHRLVLITCTTFFENMEKEGNVITMPESLPYSVVQPIINFLYSGKLEFKSELHPQLLAISKNLNITILAKLLVTQKNENGLGAAFVKPNDTKKPQRTFLATRIGPVPGGGLGGRKLPIWRQRTFPLYRPNSTRVIKDEEPKPMRFEWPEGKEPTDSLLLTSPSFTPLSYESEPVFTPANPPIAVSPLHNNYSQYRNIPLKRHASSPNAVPEKLFKEDQRDGPVEIKKESSSDPGADFSDDDDGHFETIHTYGNSDDEQELAEKGEHSQPVIRPPTSSTSFVPRSVATEPTIQTYRPVFKSHQAVHQPVTPPPQSSKAAEPPTFDPITESTTAIQTSIVHSSQIPKPILKATDPHSAQTPTKKVRFSLAEESQNSQEVSKQPPKGSLDVSPMSEVIYEAQPSLPSLPISNVHATPMSSVAQCSKTDISPEVIPSPIPLHTSPTPILPLQMSAAITPTSKPTTVQTYSKSSPSSKPEKRIISPADSANHAKIIAEVLKKYPDLVKNNKNIRLKISAPGSSNITNTLTLDTKRSAGKAYVVVKSSVKTESPSPSKLEAPSPSSSAPKPVVSAQTPQQSTLNGPWQCTPCGKDGAAIEFPSYFDYRKHVQDVHNEKLDSRTCEYCGYKTLKRNLYLYHLFTKHNVTPPKSIIFPKCEECGYVAASEGLLQKHAAMHKAAVKDWPCPRCEITFRNYTSLQAHLQSCKTNQKESLICPFCNQSFESTFILNSHIKVCSTANSVTAAKDTSHPENLNSQVYDGTGPQPEQAVEMIEVPIMNADALRGKGEHTYVQLPSGLILTDASSVALLPTSEGEDMNAVSNTMSGPIGLTVALPQDQHVILLDANSEFFIQGNDQVVVTRMNSTDEYIVPEVLDESMQQIYSTHALPYSVATTSGNMIACPVVPMQSSSHAQPIEKPEDSGNTVVRVQDHVDPNEVDNMQIQHHVNASDIESIIVHEGTSTDDLGQQRQVTSDHVDIYVEDPESQPQRHHMAINKELMDVVAMEVQRSPMMEHVPVTMSLPGTLTPQHQTVLRRPDTTCEREVVVSAASSYGSIGQSVIQEQETPSSPASQDGKDLNPNGMGASTLPGTSDDTTEVQQDGSDQNVEEVEKHAQNAAKADSLVRDWGFDNEEENDAGETVEIEDSDSDEGSQTGPSRVTVEL